MEDDPPIPEFKRATITRVRRRVYVALIVATATFILGLWYWPIRTAQMRVVAAITLEQSQGSAGAVLGQDTLSREARLQGILRDCLSDDLLQQLSQRSRLESGPASAWPTNWEIQDIRPHLHVGLTRDSAVESQRRWVQVIWSGPPLAHAPQFIDLLTQEIASRVAREIRVDAIQLRLEERLNLIARHNQQADEQLSTLLRAAEVQLEQQELTLLAWRQHRAPDQGSAGRTAAPHRELQVLKEKILTADAQLLTLLRQQVIHHFEVDESDGLVQHLEGLIRDRQAMLAQWNATSPSPQMESTGGRTVPTRMATHVIKSDNAPTLMLGDADRRVRPNPYFSAATPGQSPSESGSHEPAVAENLPEILDEVQFETLAEQLRQALQIIRTRSLHQAPAVNLAATWQHEPPLFRVVQIKPAQTVAPLDVAPSRQWAFGLALIAIMLGAAFSLQNSPESLVQTLFRPGQLADYLGIDHLGTIRTARPQPNWLDQFARLFGRRLFHAAEAVVLLCLGVIVIAMIWDPTLAETLVTDPLGGICRALWTFVRS